MLYVAQVATGKLSYLNIFGNDYTTSDPSLRSHIFSSEDHRSSCEERILATSNSCWQLWKERMVKYFDADSGGDLRNTDYIDRKGLLAGNYHFQGRDAAFTPFKIFNELHK